MATPRMVDSGHPDCNDDEIADFARGDACPGCGEIAFAECRCPDSLHLHLARIDELQAARDKALARAEVAEEAMNEARRGWRVAVAMYQRDCDGARVIELEARVEELFEETLEDAATMSRLRDAVPEEQELLNHMELLHLAYTDEEIERARESTEAFLELLVKRNRKLEDDDL